jgi:D-alanyl-D-alanine carboxypeptidase
MPPDDMLSQAAGDLVGRGLVGCVVGLRWGEGAFAAASAGYSDLEAKQAMTTDRLFRIASISKTFVFALVLRLAEERRLSLDEPIARFLPELPFANQVTLRHVLMQTGGLPVWATDRVEELPPATGWTPMQVVGFHYRATPPRAPGGPMVYANVGSRVAGVIAEKAAGKPIAPLMRDYFLDPLGLSDTVPSGAGAIRPPRLACGYDASVAHRPKDVTWAVPSEWLWAGGDMYSTAEDLTDWAQALFNGRVLDEQATRALFGPWARGGFHGSTMSHHGLGVMVFSSDGLDALGYRGTTPGFVSILGFDAETKASVSVLTNSFSPDPNSIHRSGVEQAMFAVLRQIRRAQA